MIAQQVTELLAKMTLREKVGQLTQCGNSIYNDDYKIGWELLRQGRIGSLLGIGEVEQANELQRVAVEETRLGIPLLLGFDVIHGYRTTFPVPWAEACSWEPELARATAAASTREAAANGVNWIYAPMIDVSRDPRWGRGVEGAGEDPYLVGRFAEARVKGIQGETLSDGWHAAACAKHFVAYGAAIGGKDYNSVDLAPQTVHDVYLPPFRAAIDAGAASVMTAFHDLNGEPCTGSHYWITETLRERMGFAGVVISDAGSTDQLKVHGYTADDRDTAKTALLAGLDVEMCFGIFTYQEHLEALVREGAVPVDTLDAAVRRVLTLKYELGLFEHPYRDVKMAAAALGGDGSRKLAREAARRSVVLLKNQDVLPLKKTQRMAVIGPLADDREEMLGTWSGVGRAEEAVSPWDALKTRANASHAKGCQAVEPSPALFAEAVQLAQNSEVAVVFVGEPRSMNGEGKSRTSNTLPGVQLELLEKLKATGTPLVVVVIGGRPLVLTRVAELADALLFSGALGVEAGQAYADVILGEYNSSAKLVNTFPTVVGQAPLYYNHNNTGKPPVEEFFWTSKYLDAPIKPLFPFGYGLSYSRFTYANLALSQTAATGTEVIEVRVDVTNTSAVDGEEIVQLYITDPVASLVRPVKELKGFAKVFLRAGEMKTVTLKLPLQSTGFHNRKLEYVVEKGKLLISVGTNSADTISQALMIV
ncbi:MAG: glycoside hydrolase family 3 N-terminal domain-containing protein [Lentisphaeria bacterium]